MEAVLRPPTLEETLAVGQWRTDPQVRKGLRTATLLSPTQQETWYYQVVANRDSVHRYYAIYVADQFVAFGGLTYMDMVNRHTEISLVVAPKSRGGGYGKASVDALLDEAFDVWGLRTVFGEVYENNPEAARFWVNLADDHVRLPNRKFWDGKYWDGLVFWWEN